MSNGLRQVAHGVSGYGLSTAPPSRARLIHGHPRAKQVNWWAVAEGRDLAPSTAPWQTWNRLNSQKVEDMHVPYGISIQHDALRVSDRPYR
jgi:hypothetical protein